MKPRIKIAALFEVCNEITKNAGSAQNTGMAGSAGTSNTRQREK
jgi:hypothetical protein